MHANFHWRDWRGSLKLTNPENGITIVAPDGRNVEEILGISFPKPSLPLHQDCYVRQSDLIVAYPPREMRKFHVQLDYRILDATSDTLLLEIWISVQTYLLDNHPIVNVLTPIETNGLEIYHAVDAGILVMDEVSALRTDQARAEKAPPKIAVAAGFGSGHEFSMAMFNHPRDQFDTTWRQSDHRPCLEAKLFGHFMEKGVIRRARMRCLLCSQPISLKQLQGTYESFVTSPLPLTA